MRVFKILNDLMQLYIQFYCLILCKIYEKELLCSCLLGDTSETNTKVLSRELFLGVVALKTPIQKNHYLHSMGPFPRYCHIYIYTKSRR